MSGDTGEANIVQETQAVPENNINQPEKKDNRYFCDVCKIQVTSEKNYNEHLAGQRHLKKQSSLSGTLEKKGSKSKTTKKKTSTTRKKRQQDTRKYISEKKNLCEEVSTQLSDMSIKEKSQNRTLLFVPINETMKNSSNRYDKNNRYNNREFNRYSKYSNDKYNYSNNYRYGKYNYNKYSWNSYSGQNHNFNYRGRHRFYSDDRYNVSHENNYLSENKHTFFNSFTDYGESSNSEGLNNVNHDERSENPFMRHPFSQEFPPVENPFKQLYSEDIPSTKSVKEKLCTDSSINNISEAGVSNTLEADVDKTNEPTLLKKDDASASKLKMILSKNGKKRIVFRSRSLSSSESEKKRKDKTDQTASEESEEQRIQDWTNSLLETNNNQITRLVNPSNQKEKAAVNHLITKFSKSKRKEILSRTLRTNSSELIDNDDKGANNENVSAESESVNTDDDEIEIILDSKINNFNLEHGVTNLSIPSTSKTNKSNSFNQNQNNENFLESFASSRNQRSKRNNKSSNNPSNKSSPNSSFKNKEKLIKRKSTGNESKVKKKQKTTGIINSKVTSTAESEDLTRNDSSTTPGSFLDSSESEKASNLDTPTTNIKEEILETTVDPSSTTINSEKKLEENLVFSPDISVETLIQLFASGSVKVKEEFNDPVMEALKDISPDELINACSSSSVNTHEETEKSTNLPNAKNLNDKSSSETSVHMLHNKNSIHPVILGSAAIEDSTSPISTASKDNSGANENMYSSVTHQTESVPSTSSACNEAERLSSCTDSDKISEHSSLINKTKVELPSYLNKLIKQLQDITSEEEKIKENLVEAKSKISMYTSLLEEWKGKKKKLNEQEEIMRKQRNDIIKLMQDVVKTDSDENDQASKSLPDQIASTVKQTTDKSSAEITDTSKVSPTIPPIINEKLQQNQKQNNSLPKSLESDEIIVLPAPPKPQPPEIIICDDEENVGVCNQAQVSRQEAGSSILSSSKSTVYDLKTVDAHTTVINSLVVFEDFLYTCSNDNTAKRFSLKDASLSVTYLHSAKNVTEVVVEKVQNEALVFTACSTRLISLFIASSGTKLKNFFPPCPVMSISKGWGKFYAGLANGTVNMYNWKYEEIEIVKTEQPASRIATAHQGRLHVLVILSNEGNIAIRDAETGLLIRYIKINIKHPSWMCLNNDLIYLSSSDKSLIILDIMSGKIEKKLYMNCHTTGLAVYDDYIFTVSYSGVINCYNKNNICNKKLFYGAGKGGLTCIHIYQNWVFTGSRKGDVSLFHFDPNSSIACEFGKCDIVYGLKEDLEYHIEKDHLQKKKSLTQCNWRGCSFHFPRSANIVDKMNHVKTHIYPMTYAPTIL